MPECSPLGVHALCSDQQPQELNGGITCLQGCVRQSQKLQWIQTAPRCALFLWCCNRWVIDDHLLLRIASERPSLVSLVIRPEADIDCRITEYAITLTLPLCMHQPGSLLLCRTCLVLLLRRMVNALCRCEEAVAGAHNVLGSQLS